MHQTFLSCDNPFVPEEERPLLDRRGIIRPGVSVKPGQVLVRGLSPIPFVEGEKDRVRRHIGRDSESRYSNWAAFHFANSFDERYWGKETYFGTGFLVGPEVVLTNFHAMEPVIAKKDGRTGSAYGPET